MENSTLFPREEKAELLFEKILKDPEACRRLTETFYESMDADTDIECGYLPPEKFAYALLDAYKNRDLTALLMAICQNSMLIFCEILFWHRSGSMQMDRRIRYFSQMKKEIFCGKRESM